MAAQQKAYHETAAEDEEICVRMTEGRRALLARGPRGARPLPVADGRRHGALPRIHPAGDRAARLSRHPGAGRGLIKTKRGAQWRPASLSLPLLLFVVELVHHGPERGERVLAENRRAVPRSPRRGSARAPCLCGSRTSGRWIFSRTLCGGIAGRRNSGLVPANRRRFRVTSADEILEELRQHVRSGATRMKYSSWRERLLR